MKIPTRLDFKQQNVAEIKSLKGNEIFKITLNRTQAQPGPGGIFIDTGDDYDEEFVIKSEAAVSHSHVTDPMKVMNFVDPQAGSRRLTLDEVRDLRATVRHKPALAALGNALDGAITPRQPDALGNKGPKPVFFVMRAKKLTNLEAISQDKSEIKAFRTLLQQPDVLEKFGEILAADAFIGNQDRVIFDGSAANPPMQCVQNSGNIFVSSTDWKREFVGLDTFDYSNQFKDLKTFPARQQLAAPYPGEILRNDKKPQRLTLSSKIVADFETLLGERNRKNPFGKKTQLPANAAQRICQGMETGAGKILTFLKQHYRNTPNPPEAVRQRLFALGWLNQRDFPNIVRGGGINRNPAQRGFQ